MTNSEIVKKYVETHEKPNQSVIPAFYQRWRASGETVYWGSLSCERSQWAPDTAIVRAPGKGFVKTVYVCYIPQYDMLEFSEVKFNNVGKHKDGELYNWEFDYASYRVFLIKGDPQPYDCIGGAYQQKYNALYHNSAFESYLKRLDSILYYNPRNPQYAEIEKFCGYKLTLCDFAEKYYRYVGLQQKLQQPKDSVSDMILEHISGMQRIGNHSYMAEGGFKTACFERIDENCAVIRCINTHSQDGIALCLNFEEVYRVYISKRTAKIYGKRMGLWYEKDADLSEFPVLNNDEFVQCKEVSFVYDVAVKLSDGDGILKATCQLIKHPLIERLYKAGYRNIAKYLFLNSYAESFRAIFGKTGCDNSSIYKATGCNKHMLRIIDGDMDKYSNVGNVLKMFRELYGNNFLHFTPDKIMKYLNLFIQIDRNVRIRNCNWKRLIPGSETIEGCRRFIDRLTRICSEGNYGSIGALLDTSRIYSLLQMNYNAEVADMLRCERDIYNLHDRLAEQYAMQVHFLNRRYDSSIRKSFDALTEERREVYCFENDEYKIMVPECMEEIVREGNMLHHCVGSYAKSHAKGITTILFLRRKVYPDTPFYTIEVKNNKVIQIHGFGNKWLGCTPEAIPFVHEWILKLNLSCDKRILLSKSTGYGFNGMMLDDTYLYDINREEILTA